MSGSNELPEKEWRLQLTGYGGEVQVPTCPVEWISINSWSEMYKAQYGIDKLEMFSGILEEVYKNTPAWKHVYDSNDPQDEVLPSGWNEKLNPFRKILIINAIRSDKVKNQVQNFIIDRIGKEFVDIPVFKLNQVFKDSTCCTPQVFVLSTGSDPKGDFDAFALEYGMKDQSSISLGQGQGEKAERLIRDSARSSGNGGWVLLQNCHLAISWMERLEAVVEEFNPETTHKDFRLWLTSMPSPGFPIAVLQNSVKMTIEPPTGIKSNIKNQYNILDDEKLNDCTKPDVYKKLVFGLALFHSICQERRKFGPIGWNIPYEFTLEDMICSRRLLKIFLDEYEEVPYQVINFITSDINYGGRVTDDKDVIQINSMIQIYICEEAQEDGYKYSSSGIYNSPPAGSLADYQNYIDSLPQNPSAEVFGQHDNAEINNAQTETKIMLETVLSIQPRTSGGAGKSREDIIDEIATQIEGKIPNGFNERDIIAKYPVMYEESMNTVLQQECQKYTVLIEKMKLTLFNVKRAQKGMIVMDEELELIANSLFMQQVPIKWSDVFLSLKPLQSWIIDLNKRVGFQREWVDFGTPNIFWISGFSFPQAFLTATLQNYARKYKIAIDKISFDFHFADEKQVSDIKEKPEEGIYIYGLFIEGCKWDYEKHVIGQPIPKELFSELPIVHMIPIEDRVQPEEGVYFCPNYRVTSRTGTLKTTGHSTNFVMFLELPSNDTPDSWIRAGAASFLALRY